MIKIRPLVLPVTRLINFRHNHSTAANPKEMKVKVGNYHINYVKIGNGAHNVLFLPGALGTIWTDFKPQLEGFDREKFTVLAWDPPGYGKSRPPEKEFSADFYEKDADAAKNFMKVLNIPQYSVCGWSDGATTGLIMAAKYAEVINKLVVWGANSFILSKELNDYLKTKGIKSWSAKMRQPMVEVYGEEHLAQLWARWCDGMETVFKSDKGNICSHLLKDIKCPTFILHGEKDPMVDNIHVSHLHTHIEKSRIYLYPEGKHNVHLRYAEDFNQRVQGFLLQP